MIGLYRIIHNDLLGIAPRLRALDKDYFVVYSYRDNRYEVHCKGNRGNTYCFSAPTLDERVILKARRTRRERLEALVAEMESDNRRLMRTAVSDTVKKIEMGSEKVLSKGGLI